MKKLALLLVVSALVFVPVNAFTHEGAAKDHKHDAEIIHNTIAAELKVSKKLTSSEKVTSKIALTAGKTIFTNILGNTFEAVEDDQGWYGILGLEIEFE